MPGVSFRVWRTVALIALAAIAIAVASGAYFRASSPATKPNSGTASINPLFVTSDEVRYNFLTPSLGWAVAKVVRTGQFRVFRTIDGGEHWQKQLVGVRDFAGFGFSPISVQFFDKNRGFLTIGGSVEQLYRSRNGGSNWAPVRLPSARVDAITFSDPSNGWLLVGGQAWKLLVTRDAGDTWQRLADPPVDLYGVSVRSPSEAWMGSEGFHLRHLYSSHDGGQSWQRHDLPPPLGQSWPDGTYFQASVDLLPGGGVVAVVGPLFPFEPASALFTSFDSCGWLRTGAHQRWWPSLDSSEGPILRLRAQLRSGRHMGSHRP